MPRSQSPVTTDVDFEQDGKQTSFLSVPHSHNRSAWGALRIPITVVKSGTEPTLLLVSGLHGGEYEGVVALMNLSRALRPESVHGRVIVIPALNPPAVGAGQRLSPIDGMDLNRVFPGNPRGTVSEIIAHYVTETIVPLCDAVVDLHSGGESLDLSPYISMHYLGEPLQRDRTLAALKAFQAPSALLIHEISGEGLLDYEVENQGKVFLCGEFGGMGTLAPPHLRTVERGVENLLKHFGMLQGEVATRASLSLPETRYLEVPDPCYYCAADAEGVYESFYELDDEVSAGQPVGRIHFPSNPDWEPQPVLARRAGTLLGRRGPGWVEVGDCVAVLARAARDL